MNRQDAEKKEFAEPDPKTDELARAVISAAIEVHRIMGPGFFLEGAYEAALAIELKSRAITAIRQFPIRILYKSELVAESRLDMIIENRLVVELKAVEKLLPIHMAQILSYLKATQLHLGLLINFNVPILKEGIKRIILS